MLEETHSKILISINNASFNLLQISNLNIVQGEKYFVTGSSSSGKSTLIRLLFGDLNPQKGQVFISKKKVHRVLIPKRPEFFETTTGYDNLLISYDINLHKNLSSFEQQIKEYCLVLNFSYDDLKVKMKNYSDGMKYQIALIRALLSFPELLFIDEIGSSLDSSIKDQIYLLLSKMTREQGVTFVWAERELADIQNFNGKRIHLNQGHIEYMGELCIQ